MLSSDVVLAIFPCMVIGRVGNVDLFALLGWVEISILHSFVGFDFTLVVVIIGVVVP